VLNLISI